MEMIEICDEEFKTHIIMYKKAITQLNLSSGDNSEQAIKDMQHYSNEAKKTYEHMKLELNDLQSHDRLRMAEKLKNYGQEIEAMRKE